VFLSFPTFAFKDEEEIEFIANKDEKTIKHRLENFESHLPEEYRIAAKEGVNNKRERLIRNSYLDNIFMDDADRIVVPVLFNE